MRFSSQKDIMRIVILVLGMTLLHAPAASAGLLEELTEGILNANDKKHDSQGTLDSKTIVAGLKEALSVGIKNSVNSVSRQDGYFGNQLIKIVVPEKMHRIAEVLRETGFRKEVDRFELSMNRAAEEAAPKARSFFVEAVKNMTIHDAETILRGGETAATDYLKSKTYDHLYTAFKPVIAKTVNSTGATRSFQDLMDIAETLPFLKEQAVDLDRYVTEKALDGLFFMVSEEEKKIRKDPTARVTKLLKSVFQ